MSRARALAARVTWLACVLAGGCVARDGASAARARLEVSLLGERSAPGQIAGQTRWAACAAASDSSLVPVTRCSRHPAVGTRAFDRLARTERDASAWLRSDSSPTALRARALLALRWRDVSPAGAERAVQALERAHDEAPGDAALLNDLAVAYLALAERSQTLDPLLRALDAAERAVAADSTLPAARFNRALARERLFLVESAIDAWGAYLAVERRPDWVAEARAHRDRLAASLAPGQHADPSVVATPDGPGPAAERFRHAVMASPQQAREHGVAVLGEWGEAVARHDSASAARALARVRAIAAVLPDRSLSLAVASIDGVAQDGTRTRVLARGHAELARGLGQLSRVAYDDGVAPLASAERLLRARRSPAAGWAALYLGMCEVYRGNFSLADAAFHRARDGAATAQPALVGKALWGLGVSQVRRGGYDAAAWWYRQAAPFFDRAAERENQGAVDYLQTEAWQFAGRPDAGGLQGLRGLRLLAPFRRSSYLDFHLATVAAYARARGLALADLAVMDEAVAVASRIPRPQLPSYAHLSRARTLIAIGRPTEARAELDASLRWADHMEPGRGRDRARADAQLVLAQLARATDARAALALLGPVVDAYATLGADAYLVQALQQAGLAAAAAADTATARRHLVRAVATIERMRNTTATAEERATLYAVVESVFDAITLLELASGRSDSAFAYVERGRLAVWNPSDTGRGHAPPARPLAALAGLLPDDMVFVEFALLPDRLVAWTASRRGRRHHVVAIARDSIAAMVRRLPARPDVGARLFALLVRPIAAELRGARRLVVVPDRELTRVPFAALQDGVTGRFLVEDLEVHTLPTAAFLATRAAAPRGPAAAGVVLVVGAPSADAAPGVPLQQLPNAAREADRVARLYPTARLLTGTGAGRRAVLAWLPRATVFHFAGHAVGDEDRPDRSFLALGTADGDDGALRAREIGRLRLSHLRLVVLSACTTLNGRPSRMGAVAGLAFSFLRAGVPSTVSTLWDVADRPTADVLVAFHRHLAAGAAAPTALRLAQIDALRSGDPMLRDPRAWAAFVYTGP